MNKKILSIILIFIFLLSVIPMATASDDDDRYYGISSTDLYLNITDEGLLKVNESYDYHFEGQFNGVYRDIPLKEGQSVENLKVSADGAYTKVEEKLQDNTYKIKVYLYSDPEMTHPIRDTSVEVNYTYDFKGVVKIYEDVGEIQFKLWGNDWDVGSGRLTAQIEFPDDDKIEYWINPLDNEAKVSQNGNVLTVEDDYVYSDSYLEFRGVIPLSEFKNPVYAQKIDHKGYDEIVKIQEDYEWREGFISSLVSITPFLLVFSLVIPVIIYFRYGREPKVGYNAAYEHELPTDDSPMFVDAMFGTKSDTGKLSENGIQAAIMELIDDGVIEIANRDEESKELKLILPDDVGDVSVYKRMIINNLLRPHARGDVLDFNLMKKDLGSESVAKAFNRNLQDIKDDYYKMEILPILSNYFDNTGSLLFRIYCGALAAISFIILICSIIWMGESLTLFFVSLFFFIVGCSMFAIPNRVAGRWSEKGMTDYKKWKAFKKFIKDFSLIKQHPPESVAMWDKYLVYATALGNAKAVSKAMKSIAPAAVYDHSNLYYYSHVGGPTLFATAVHTSNSTVSNSGAGGVGGGSGGGGGGAF